MWALKKKLGGSRKAHRSQESQEAVPLPAPGSSTPALRHTRSDAARRLQDKISASILRGALLACMLCTQHSQALLCHPQICTRKDAQLLEGESQMK